MKTYTKYRFWFILLNAIHNGFELLQKITDSKKLGAGVSIQTQDKFEK